MYEIVQVDECRWVVCWGPCPEWVEAAARRMEAKEKEKSHSVPAARASGLMNIQSSLAHSNDMPLMNAAG